MPTFIYKAYNRGGGQVAGSIEAAGPKEAAQALKNTGLYPTEVKEAGKAGGHALFSQRVSPSALASAARQLATLISSGTSISEALEVLADNTDNPKLRSILLETRDSVLGGSSFSKALEKNPEVFSPLFRGLVQAAEASGSLDQVLPRLADYLEKRARIRSEVRAALTYPALMTIVGAAVLGFLFVFVIPKISRIFEDTGTRLPFITIVLLWITGIVRSYWPALLGLSGGAFWFIRRSSRSERARELKDRLLLKLPWFGPIVLSFHMANLTRTLGTLLKGGVQMLKALEICAEALDNKVFNNVLETAAKDCTEGSSLSTSLKKSALVPPLVCHMISVGERSGNLDEMLLKTAESYDAAFEDGVKRSLSLLEPVLILAMGLVVGFIVLAMLLPIFELNQTIR
ncbi:MAG: type II secretion system F family protein [Deltaproteobacteria bacterium]|nr:type II secretion system F family protein [Deltaproteobacteria bacterium]